MSGKSTLNDLKQFRLLKKDTKMENGQEQSQSSLGLIPGKKRIQVIQDSENSESENDGGIDMPIKKQKIELTPKEKESRYISALKIESGYDPMDVQDALLRCDWDVSQSIRYLKEHCKKLNLSVELTNGKTQTKKKHGDEDYDSDQNYSKTKELVFDSDDDDSDTEISDYMGKDKKSVFDFFNNASQHELLSIKSCSEKKAASLIELRPFKSWSDLVHKLQNQKLLSTDLLNNCQELLRKRENLANVLTKCNKLVNKLESAIESGGGITIQPSILNSNFKLAEYQMIGLNWLAVMHKQEMNGILADEMGLGKTIQVIAFLAYLKENNLARGAHLIVVPSSTMDNWESEILAWCPSLVTEKYYGNQEERRTMRIQYAKHGFEGIDIILTTYHTVGSTPEERKMFRVSKLHYVIFDEAHMLKNMTTQRYAQLITINAERRILLTGTPLQNNLLELMSLLCFVMPSFFARNQEDIKSLFQKVTKTQKSNDVAPSFEKNQIDQAKRIMKPFLLRRLKKDVLKYLPQKSEFIEKVQMTASQQEYYKNLVDYYANEKGIIKGSTEIAGMAIMMDMRKLANHPLLMRYYYSDDTLRDLARRLARLPSYKKDNEQYIFEDLAYQSDFQIWQICEKYGVKNMNIPDELVLNSGKFNFLSTLLPELKEGGHRTLLFSQFTIMLDVVEKFLQIKGYGYLRLDGSTVVTERQEMIDEFNENPDIFIFLLSTKAGGMGINLTAADTAIIHDIDFNPYNDKQAEDRCHRMGQTKPVSIYRLISEGTIEEGMLMVAQEKLQLEREINKEKDDVQEHKCMVRLLTMSLGLDACRAENLLSPPQKKVCSPNTSTKTNLEADHF